MFKLALAQMHVTSCKATNLERAAATIGKAAQSGAKMVALPECFNSPYGTQFFAEYAEPIPGKTTEMLSLAARQHKVCSLQNAFLSVIPSALPRLISFRSMLLAAPFPKRTATRCTTHAQSLILKEQ